MSYLPSFLQNQQQGSEDSRMQSTKSRRYPSSKDWLRDCQRKNSSKMTPDLRQKMQAKARRQRAIGKKCKRAKVYQRANAISKNAWAQGNLRVMAAPQAHFSAEKSNVQMKSVQAIVSNQSAWAEDDDDAEDALELALDMVAVEQNQDEIQVRGDQQMSEILMQLMKEPDNDAERKQKFDLYETFLETVTNSRQATFDFWKECKADFSEVANAMGQIEQDMKNIDKEENLGIVWMEHRWYVYDMMVQADKNNDMLKQLLKRVETKLELLGRADDDCPFCLEPLAEVDEVKTISCCHKCCAECWNHWEEIKGRNAFCPLCRQDDFLQDVMSLQQ